MIPKKKAEELFNKYVELSGIFVGDYESEKEMCLIVVNEILEELLECGEVWMKSRIKYWQEVKQEIEHL